MEREAKVEREVVREAEVERACMGARADYLHGVASNLDRGAMDPTDL